MSESPRIVSVTEFERSPRDGQWYWRTRAANGEIVGGSAGEGYKELRKAVNGFFAQQGVEPDELSLLPPEHQRYSKLYRASDTFSEIRKYAHGAPEPYEP